MGERALIVVFLRGAADGLTLVPPVGDDDYHRARPTLAVHAKQGLKLDGFFALHPLLAPLQPRFEAGELSIVHACGSQDDTRSHFYAQDLMERAGVSVSGGWLGRFLRAQLEAEGGGFTGGALDALSVGTAVCESLRGAPTVTAMESLSDLGGGAAMGRLRQRLGCLYESDQLLGAPARSALDASARLAQLEDQGEPPRHGAIYPSAATDGDVAQHFGVRMRLVARLIHGGLGLRAACVDIEGWDSHFVQSSLLEPQLRALGSGLAAFARDLGPRLADTSVVVMTEFGRRVGENASLGTDHGRGGAMFVLGGGTRGGVHCRWPSLRAEALDGPGDLPVVHDYRDVLAGVLARHGAVDLARVFPDCTLAPMDV
ncbi:MAG TPA: DUF1501 domain-containing protein [Planctomycetota bacterium]|nr:DUF1501 domain-containing protein [Planctomycetota bacterium]